MAQNLQLDSVKRDYVVVNGSPIGSDRVEEAAYYALLIPQGKWLYGDVDQGSLLYTLDKQKRSSSIEQDFAGYAQDAIKRQVIDTGKATASAVKNFETTRFGTSNLINIVPAQTQLSDQLSFVSV
jgi:phage gp46-like protein